MLHAPGSHDLNIGVTLAEIRCHVILGLVPDSVMLADTWTTMSLDLKRVLAYLLILHAG